LEKPLKRRFEFIGGTSAKFWEVAVNGGQVEVTFGRIGTADQTQDKSFAHAAAATKHAIKLIEQKLAKGYVELTAAH
jgi:predicted DNA-binding WGR domain protein